VTRSIAPPFAPPLARPSPRALPVWRSLLFVPAHVERFVSRAHTRGADCIQLDLEDAVPPGEKAAARAAIASAASQVRRGGADVLVRINAPLSLAVPDIQAAIGPDVDGIMITKARGADHVRLIEELVAECEAAAGIEVGRTWLYPLIETPEALPAAHAIASASPRVVALTLGAEDFSTAIGGEPDEATLLVPKHMIVHAARAVGVLPIGLLGSLADFSDPAALRDMAVRSRRAGFDGANCINPAQVAPLNAAFTPATEEVVLARRIVAAGAAAASEGRGAVALDGKMIDTPVIRRAERLIARADAIAARQARAHE
jgi:citrate lyase subunit beta/citryl-CoA lyase